MIDLDDLKKNLKLDEGFEPRVYTCSANKLTIGYGWNLEDNDMPEHIAAQLLDHVVMQKLSRLSNHDWFCGLNDARKQAILNLSFNIGTKGVLKFKRMIAAIEAHNYYLAASEMKDSKWYRQVGGRAVRLVDVMRNG